MSMIRDIMMVSFFMGIPFWVNFVGGRIDSLYKNPLTTINLVMGVACSAITMTMFVMSIAQIEKNRKDRRDETFKAITARPIRVRMSSSEGGIARLPPPRPTNSDNSGGGTAKPIVRPPINSEGKHDTT